MDDAQAASGSGSVTIPPEIRQKFPEIIDLILGSESMNDEERQYWINILPIMTPDQLDNLQNILLNEKKQLAAIDRKYATEVEKIGQTELLEKAEEERKHRRAQRQEQEQSSLEEETELADDILKQIEEA